MLLRNTHKSNPSRMGTVLDETADLPRGARQVLDRVFWGQDLGSEPLARVLPFRPRQAARPSPLK